MRAASAGVATRASRPKRRAKGGANERLPPAVRSAGASRPPGHTGWPSWGEASVVDARPAPPPEARGQLCRGGRFPGLQPPGHQPATNCLAQGAPCALKRRHLWGGRCLGKAVIDASGAMRQRTRQRHNEGPSSGGQQGLGRGRRDHAGAPAKRHEGAGAHPPFHPRSSLARWPSWLSRKRRAACKSRVSHPTIELGMERSHPWHKPIHRNAQITTSAYLKDLVEHDTRFAGRAIQQIYHVDFYDETGDQLASADTWCFRTDRDLAREAGTKYQEVKHRPPKVYTQEELARIYALYEHETICGKEPRYWDDVAVGTLLPTLVKGPMTVTGFIAYAQGWGGLYI